MAVIPPPVSEHPKRSIASTCVLAVAVGALLFTVAVISVILLGYSRLDAPPAKAAEIRARASALYTEQEAALDAAREVAGEALAEDFQYDGALRRWHRQRDSELHDFLRQLLQYPEGFPDNHWIIHADRADASDAWPGALHPGRHDLQNLYENAAEWLDADEALQDLIQAIRHGIAWRVLDPVTEAYSHDAPYLDAVDHLGVIVALRGLAAARLGDRATAWECLLLLTELSGQLLREPDTRAATSAMTLPFWADIVLWALADDGPDSPGERDYHARIQEARVSTVALADTLLVESALAPGRREAGGVFPRVAERVLFDRFWDVQQELIGSLEEAPRDAIQPLRERFRAVPLYAEESTSRLRRNLYLYRIHWQSRFCWELRDTASALKEWKEEEGAYPDTLEELQDAGLIPAVPEDPVWGEPIRYQRLGEGFALYMLRVEDWYWLHDRWLEQADPNDLDRPHGLDWEIVWRALR